MGRYQYRYQKYRHIGTFFSIGIGKQKSCRYRRYCRIGNQPSIDIFLQMESWEDALSSSIGISSIGISAYRQKCGNVPSLVAASPGQTVDHTGLAITWVAFWPRCSVSWRSLKLILLPGHYRRIHSTVMLTAYKYINYYWGYTGILQLQWPAL